MAGLTIGKFAAAEGVGVETVRFYQRRGLLALPELAFIRRARRLGFTLGEIADLLGPAEARSTDDIVRAAQVKLWAINEQVGELALLECRLRRLVEVCEHGNGDDCVALHLGELPQRTERPMSEPEGLMAPRRRAGDTA